MAFGVDPNVLAVTPGMLLQAEAERRRRQLEERRVAIAEARAVLEARPTSYGIPWEEWKKPSPKPESWTRPSFQPGEPIGESTEERTAREMALLAERARLAEKPPKELSFEEEKIREMWGGMTEEERKQFLGARIKPLTVKEPKYEEEEEEIPEEVSEELVPTGWTEKGGIKYGLPKKEKEESWADTIKRVTGEVLAEELGIPPLTEEVGQRKQREFLPTTRWLGRILFPKKKTSATDVLGIR